MTEREPFEGPVGEPSDDTAERVPSEGNPIGTSNDGVRKQHKRVDAATAYARASQHVQASASPASSTPATEDDSPHGFGELDEAEDDGTQVANDLDELSAKAEKADEYLALAQRTQADFENYRKRAARDAALAQDRGIAKLAKELLPAVDNLERAVQAAGDGDDGTGILDGLKLVQAEVLSALARVGIEPFSPTGEPFDPQFHEAVAQNQVPGVGPGTVLEVYQRGFRLGETVLRPARVLVAA